MSPNISLLSLSSLLFSPQFLTTSDEICRVNGFKFGDRDITVGAEIVIPPPNLPKIDSFPSLIIHDLELSKMKSEAPIVGCMI